MTGDRDGDADALRLGGQLGKLDGSVGQGNTFTEDGGLDSFVDRPYIVTGEAGRQRQADFVKDEALGERLKDFLDIQGDDATRSSILDHNELTDELDLRLLACKHVFTDDLVSIDLGIVGLGILSGQAAHPHFKELILAHQCVVLLGLRIVALALLLLACIGDFGDAVAVLLILVQKAAHDQSVLFHLSEQFWIDG